MRGPERASNAQISFERATWEVYHLFDIHDELIADSQNAKEAEKAIVLVKSAYLFITACWESYIEDLCGEALSCLLRHNAKGRGWIGNVMKKQVRHLVDSFHTPRSKNIHNLYAKAIGITDLTNSWKWNRVTVSQAQTTLGTYIDIRAEIAHGSRASRPISKTGAEDYLDFIWILASKTERRVQDYVKRITGSNFGKTRKVR